MEIDESSSADRVQRVREETAQADRERARRSRQRLREKAAEKEQKKQLRSTEGTPRVGVTQDPFPEREQPVAIAARAQRERAIAQRRGLDAPAPFSPLGTPPVTEGGEVVLSPPPERDEPPESDESQALVPVATRPDESPEPSVSMATLTPLPTALPPQQPVTQVAQAVVVGVQNIGPDRMDVVPPELVRQIVDGTSPDSQLVDAMEEGIVLREIPFSPPGGAEEEELRNALHQARVDLVECHAEVDRLRKHLAVCQEEVMKWRQLAREMLNMDDVPTTLKEVLRGNREVATLRELRMLEINTAAHLAINRNLLDIIRTANTFEPYLTTIAERQGATQDQLVQLTRTLQEQREQTAEMEAALHDDTASLATQLERLMPFAGQMPVRALETLRQIAILAEDLDNVNNEISMEIEERQADESELAEILAEAEPIPTPPPAEESAPPPPPTPAAAIARRSHTRIPLEELSVPELEKRMRRDDKALIRATRKLITRGGQIPQQSLLSIFTWLRSNIGVEPIDTTDANEMREYLKEVESSLQRIRRATLLADPDDSDYMNAQDYLFRAEETLGLPGGLPLDADTPNLPCMLECRYDTIARRALADIKAYRENPTADSWVQAAHQESNSTPPFVPQTLDSNANTP